MLASRAGFEPATCRLGGGDSIHLSYRDVMNLQVLQVLAERAGVAGATRAPFVPVRRAAPCCAAPSLRGRLAW